MNGFTASDMSTAAANGHAEGYQAGYADAVKAVEVGKPAAAQEAVATANWKDGRLVHVLDCSPMPGGVYRLYADPVAAAPVVPNARITEPLRADESRQEQADAAIYNRGWTHAGLRDIAGRAERLATDLARQGADAVTIRKAEGIAAIARQHGWNDPRPHANQQLTSHGAGVSE